jgi:hypothetical protein
MHFPLQDEERSGHADAVYIGERTDHLVSVLSISILWSGALCPHSALAQSKFNLTWL